MLVFPRRWLIILGALVLVVPLQQSSSKAQAARVLVSRKQATEVSVSEQQVVDKLGYRGFVVESTAAGTKKRHIVPSQIEMPRTLDLVNARRAVLLGSASGPLDALTVFDPSTGAEQLSIPCWFPSLSPTGRYVAFVKFFSRHFVPNKDTGFVYQVIDFASLGKAAFSINDEDAGSTVYPSLPPPDASDNDDSLHRLTGPLKWVSNDAFAFNDNYRGSTTNVIVRRVKNGWATSARAAKKSDVGPS